jgi:AraC family transcriptional regulator, transcriptional activator FtrA
MPTSVKIVPKRPRARAPQNRLVVALAYDGLCTFEFGVAVEIFGLERPEMGGAWYRFGVAAIEPGPLRAAGGIRIESDGGLRLVERAGTIIVPGWRGAEARVPDRLIAALRRAHKRGARLLSFCSGVFVLAATGLLDGRRATTHWRYAERLARAYPQISVVPDVLYIDEGNLLTAAGSAAGIDLSLHLIRRDWGASAANSVARRLVVPPHRDGGQAQFIERPGEDRVGTLEETRRWAAERLGEQLDVAAMARHAAVSPRTFARRFREETGTTPLQWLLSQRVLEARRLLERTDLPIDEVAWRSGFGTAASLRDHFRRVTATTPTAYRRSFQPQGAT